MRQKIKVTLMLFAGKEILFFDRFFAKRRVVMLEPGACPERLAKERSPF